MLMFSTLTFAQKITFDYDTMGNQIVRIYFASGNKMSEDPIKEYKDLVDADLKKFHPEDEFSYYPNPVIDELFIQIPENLNKEIISFEVYNSNGQLIKHSKLVNNYKTTISFSDLSVGTYFLNITFSNQEQKSITIIKK